LNPAISDDGRVVVFESSADFSNPTANASFRTYQATLAAGNPIFREIGATRAVAPAVSGDGKIVVFSSAEDLTGQNPDRNFEIFMFDGFELKQLTQTVPASSATRLTDGNFQPSLTPDGRMIAFSSNRDFNGQNADSSYEVFLYRTPGQSFVQLTNSTSHYSGVSPKIGADGARVYYKRTSVDDPEVSDLVLVHTQTSTAELVATNVPELSLAEGRAVSNDGMRLVYSALTAPNQSQVFVFDGHDHSTRQLTQLGSRVVDVKLHATISGDGKRVAFATRRRVTVASDGGVELYLLDLPTGEIQQITNAPAAATAEVVSSLNFDGTLVAFSFPRILFGPVDDNSRNNSEIYLASLAARPLFGSATALNAAAKNNEPGSKPRIAPGSIATIRGSALAFKTEAASVSVEEPPFMLAGTKMTVTGIAARVVYVSPDEIVFVVPDSLLSGPAEFVATNSFGFSSLASGAISAAAPGLFTVTGDGRGQAIVLNSDTLLAGPFDPSNGRLRVSIFATGVAQASSVSVTIKGQPVLVETVARASLKGLDEIHVLVSAALAGSGSSALVVTADGVQSNPATIVLTGVAPTPTPTPSPSPTPSATPTPSPAPTPTPESQPRIVISQIYGGGGNSGAPFRNDFIEIFNRGNSPVNLEGWSIQYASATASTWSVTPLTSFVLLPGQYYLIQQSSGGANGLPLPAPDATGTIAMAAGAGKVALVRNANALTGACPNNANIVDLAGYGNTANCFSGAAPAPAASNTNAILRTANGCTDSQNNAMDFAAGSPNPRNKDSPLRICAN
jgi:uncharacterized protein (TIGR03437 family)